MNELRVWQGLALRQGRKLHAFDRQRDCAGGRVCDNQMPLSGSAKGVGHEIYSRH